MICYAITMRPYWGIVVALYVLGRVLLPRVRGLLPVLIMVLATYGCLQLAFNTFLGESLSFSRTSVNTLRADINISVGSLIVDFLPDQVALQWLNAFLVFLSLIAPWPLILGGSSDVPGDGGRARLPVGPGGLEHPAAPSVSGPSAPAVAPSRSHDRTVERAKSATGACRSPVAGAGRRPGDLRTRLRLLRQAHRADAPAVPRSAAAEAEADRRSDVTAGVRVLHVTDASSSGVLTAVTTIARQQSEDSRFTRVVFAYVPRPDSPSEGDIQALTGPGVEVEKWSNEVSVRRLVALARTLFVRLRTETFDVVHLHSSRTGVLGRWVAMVTSHRGRSIYSPHAFAFAYSHWSRPRRLALWALELVGMIAGRRLVLNSASEQRVARRAFPWARTAVLVNTVDVARLRQIERLPDEPPWFAHVGRIAPAKAPDVFARVCQCRGRAGPRRPRLLAR